LKPFKKSVFSLSREDLLKLLAEIGKTNIGEVVAVVVVDVVFVDNCVVASIAADVVDVVVDVVVVVDFVAVIAVCVVVVGYFKFFMGFIKVKEQINRRGHQKCKIQGFMFGQF